MNLGLLGGTFDPPHLGHLHLAGAAQQELALDEILFVPCHQQPLKSAPPEASSWHRCAMLALALQGRPTWKLCIAEVERGALSFTAETLEILDARFPGHTWTLLLGADSLENFPLWHHWKQITGRARIAAAAREEGSALNLPDPLRGSSVRILGAEAFPVQSRNIRQGLREGLDVSRWLPPPVHEYVIRQGLYLGGNEFAPRKGCGEEVRK